MAGGWALCGGRDDDGVCGCGFGGSEWGQRGVGLALDFNSVQQSAPFMNAQWRNVMAVFVVRVCVGGVGL